MASLARSRTGLLAVAVGLGGLASPEARAGDTRFESADIFYATHELSEGGRPLYRRFFREGWPTSPPYRRLTQELAQEPADLIRTSFLASGAGLPMSASRLAHSRLEDARRAGSSLEETADLVRRDVSNLKSLAGFTGRVPSGFDPTALPYRRASATLDGSWRADEIASWRWKEGSGGAYGLAGMGFALLAEVQLARRELRAKEGEDPRRGDPIGREPRDAFLALVALQSAVAKAWEIEQLVYDSHRGDIEPRSDLFSLEALRYHLPHRWTSRVADGRAAHEIADGQDDDRSHLASQAALLLGLCQLAAISDPEASPPFPELFAGDLGGAEVPPFPPDTHEVVVDAAVFVFRSLRSLHIDVVKRQAVSLSRGRTVRPRDVGLYLLAMQSFLEDVRYPGEDGADDPTARELEDEQAKAQVLMATLGTVLQGWIVEEDEAGYFDAYSVSDDARSTTTRSLATQGLAIRGLLACHQVHAQLPEEPLETALRVVRWLDREHWDPRSQAYVEFAGEERSASLFGAAAVLGALRELALETGDGAFLLRYRQYLESLHENGFFRSPGGGAAPGLSLDLSFE